MRLFTVGKIGCFCDTITHATEARRDQEVKIVILTLRVQPFDATHASAMVDGVRVTLFRLNHPEPKESLRRVDFALGVPRQTLHVYAAPDTEQASIVLDQAAVSHTYARTQKDVRGYAFTFKVAFGPCGRQELEFVQDWHLGQRFVTFEVAEPGLFDEAPAGSTESDPAVTQNVIATPMFDDPRDDAPAPPAPRARGRRKADA
jgi:hypothetical protein